MQYFGEQASKQVRASSPMLWRVTYASIFFTIVFIFLYFTIIKKKNLQHESSVLKVKMRSKPSSKLAAFSGLRAVLTKRASEIAKSLGDRRALRGNVTLSLFACCLCEITQIPFPLGRRELGYFTQDLPPKYGVRSTTQVVSFESLKILLNPSASPRSLHMILYGWRVHVQQGNRIPSEEQDVTIKQMKLSELFPLRKQNCGNFF